MSTLDGRLARLRRAWKMHFDSPRRFILVPVELDDVDGIRSQLHDCESLQLYSILLDDGSSSHAARLITDAENGDCCHRCSNCPYNC